MIINPVVLAFVRYYLPGYKSGGPVRTIANMAAALGEDIDFLIITSDRDATETKPYPHLIGKKGWQEVGNAKVHYLPPSHMRLTRIARIIYDTPHDTLYLNSFFDPVFTLRPLLARYLGLIKVRRCVIAPRGELSAGALDIKAAKKRVFLSISRTLGLYRDLIWQASSEYEAEDIRRTMGSVAADIRIAPNLPARVDPQGIPIHRPSAKGEPLRIVFLARISPMKNLDFALEVLRQVRVPIRFDIYGQPEDRNYWGHCQALISEMPEHVAVRYCGSIDHRRVLATLAQYDLFFLPTRGENYGHAIIESFSVGTPVIISDATPWRHLAGRGVGWDLSLADQGAFAARLEEWSMLSAEERVQVRRRVISFFNEQVKSTRVVADNYSLFELGQKQPVVEARN